MAYFGLYFYIVSLYIRPQDFWGPLVGFPIDYVIFAFVLLTGLSKVHKIPQLLSRPQSTFFMLWLLWIFLSDLTNGLISLAFSQFFIYLKFFIVYLFAAMHVDTVNKLRALLLFMIAMTLLLALQGAYQWEHGVGWAGQTLGYTDTKGFRIRWIGLWDGYNVLCLLFVLGMAFLLKYFLRPYNIFANVLACLVAVSICYAIYLTKSRGGVVGMAGVLGVYFFFIIKSKFIKFVLAPVLAFSVMIGVTLFGGTDDKENSAGLRVSLWGDGLSMLKYNPLFGVGKGTFKYNSGSRIAHSSYVEVAAETGIPGFVFWLGIIYASLKGLWLYIKQTTVRKDWLTGVSLLSGLIGYLMASIFLTTEFELFYFLHALIGSFVALKIRKLPFGIADLRIIFMAAFSILIFYWIVTIIYF